MRLLDALLRLLARLRTGGVKPQAPQKEEEDENIYPLW